MRNLSKIFFLILLGLTLLGCSDDEKRFFSNRGPQKTVTLASPFQPTTVIFQKGGSGQRTAVSKGDSPKGGSPTGGVQEAEVGILRRKGSLEGKKALDPQWLKAASLRWGMSEKRLSSLWKKGVFKPYEGIDDKLLIQHDFRRLFPSFRCFACDKIFNDIWDHPLFLTGVATNPVSVASGGSEPDVAYDPDRHHYLIVWSEEGRAGRQDVYAKLVDRDGVAERVSRRRISVERPTHGCLYDRFTEEFGLTNPTDCQENREPVAAYKNGRFLIAWTLKGTASHPRGASFSVILGQMVEAETLEPVNTNWTEGRLLSKIQLFSNQDGVRPRNDDEIMSWSSHEKPHVIALNNADAFFTVWQTNKDTISCVDSDRWLSRSVYGRVIDFDFGPGRSRNNPNKDLIRIYSDSSNNPDDDSHPEYRDHCVPRADVVTTTNPRVAFNPDINKLLVVFESRVQSVEARLAIAGQVFGLSGSLDPQTFNPWNATPIDSTDSGNSNNPDVVALDDRFVVANDQDKSALMLQTVRYSPAGLVRVGTPALHRVCDGELDGRGLCPEDQISVASRPRLLVSAKNDSEELIVSYEKRSHVGDTAAVIEASALNGNLDFIERPVSLAAPDRTINIHQELAPGENRFVAVWFAKGDGRGDVFSSLAEIVATPVNERPTARIETVPSGITEVRPRERVNLSGGRSSDPENGTTDLVYHWEAISDLPVTFSRNNTMETFFVAPSLECSQGETECEAPIEIRLTVTDLNGLPSEPASVTIRVKQSVLPNQSPIARLQVSTINVSETQPDGSRTRVTLDAGSSTDPEGTPLRYIWTPEDPSQLSNIDDRGSTYSFLVPDVHYQSPQEPEVIHIQLVVSDGELSSTPVEATVTVDFVNRPPVVDLGPDREVNEGEEVILIADISDPDDPQPVPFASWEQVSGPPVSIINFEGGRQIWFTAPSVAMDTPLEFEISVLDEGLLGATDRIQVLVKDRINAPVSQRPADGVVLSPTRVLLQWDEVEEEGVDYTVFFEPVNPPMRPVGGCENIGRTYCVVDNLAPETTYFWQVEARKVGGGRAVSSSFRVVTDNSVAGWWRFDEGPGFFMLGDASGHGNNGALMGEDGPPLWQPGLIGGALWFDGVDDRISLLSHNGFPLAREERGVFLWISWEGPDDDRCTFSSPFWYGSASPGSANAIDIKRDSGALRIISVVDDTALTPVGISRATWNQVGFTYDGTLVRIYINGEEVWSEEKSWDTLWSEGEFGRRFSDCYFRGLIDEAVVYSRSISPEAIRSNYCVVQIQSDAGPLPPLCQ
ncbi:MAG: hypothetical protein HYS22_06005 [Deltaproteobacteria bacterium]|nr:hypothetical protein [Deltaproteobacteria bacterium]